MLRVLTDNIDSMQEQMKNVSREMEIKERTSPNPRDEYYSVNEECL